MRRIVTTLCLLALSFSGVLGAASISFTAGKHVRLDDFSNGAGKFQIASLDTGDATHDSLTGCYLVLSEPTGPAFPGINGAAVSSFNDAADMFSINDGLITQATPFTINAASIGGDALQHAANYAISISCSHGPIGVTFPTRITYWGDIQSPVAITAPTSAEPVGGDMFTITIDGVVQATSSATQWDLWAVMGWTSPAEMGCGADRFVFLTSVYDAAPFGPNFNLAFTASPADFLVAGCTFNLRLVGTPLGFTATADSLPMSAAPQTGVVVFGGHQGGQGAQGAGESTGNGQAVEESSTGARGLPGSSSLREERRKAAWGLGFGFLGVSLIVLGYCCYSGRCKPGAAAKPSSTSGTQMAGGASASASASGSASASSSSSHHSASSSSSSSKFTTTTTTTTVTTESSSHRVVIVADRV